MWISTLKRDLRVGSINEDYKRLVEDLQTILNERSEVLDLEGIRKVLEEYGEQQRDEGYQTGLEDGRNSG